MREAVVSNSLGLVLKARIGSRNPAVYATDVEFADDLTLISDSVLKAQQLVSDFERWAAIVGLKISKPKSEIMLFNCVGDITVNCLPLKQVDDVKFLGSWLRSSTKDFNIRKSLAWTACFKLKPIWVSSLSRDVKINCFMALVESILLYCSETWTLTKKLSTLINGTYTKLLRSTLNVHWSSKTSNKELYGKLSLVSENIKVRRMKLFGHISRRHIQNRLLIGDEVIDTGLFFASSVGRRVGRPHNTYLDNLCDDFVTMGMVDGGANNKDKLASLKTIFKTTIEKEVWLKKCNLLRTPFI